MKAKLKNISQAARKIAGALANHPERRWTAAEIQGFTGLPAHVVNDGIAVLRQNKAIGRRKIPGVFGSYSYKIRRRVATQAILPGILDENRPVWQLPPSAAGTSAHGFI